MLKLYAVIRIWAGYKKDARAPDDIEFPRQRFARRAALGDRLILQFTISKEIDPDRSKLRRVLEAQFAYERMHEARSWFVHLLGLVGVVVWLEAIWPDWPSSDIRFFTLAVFGGVLFLVVRALIAEFVSHCKLKRCVEGQRDLTLHKPKPLP